MLEIDGSLYSGSGTIVRQAVAFAALTGRAVHIINVRAKRPKPGLRHQHVQVVESIRQLVAGSTEGVRPGSREILFGSGRPAGKALYKWDIGSAGSTTALALAVLPVLAFGPCSVTIELRGGLFQDFAPSVYHLEHVMLPLVRRMGVAVRARMERPGYVPMGGGILHLEVGPAQESLQPLTLDHGGSATRIWGIALSSRLKQQEVSHRMADSARHVLQAVGYRADVQEIYDESALQPGAGMALFAELEGGACLGADRAGAPGRRSEAIGRSVSRQLLEDLQSGATLDRYASDQIIPFAALAAGTSRFLIPRLTDHIESNGWLSREFLGAEVLTVGQELIVRGVGFRGRAA